MLKSQIITHYKQAGNKAMAKPMAAYMQNRFEFFGIKTPERRAISKHLLHELKTLSPKDTVDLAKSLWNEPQRELHYFAQELLLQNFKKNFSVSDIEWMQWFIVHQSWWDTVDVIAPKLIARYMKEFPQNRDDMVKKWISSDNIWLMRSALLFQLKQKEQVDFQFLFSTILKLNHTKEFFINKAIGWVLREYAKTNRELIYTFIENNRGKLSPLSVREGMKHAL